MTIYLRLVTSFTLMMFIGIGAPRTAFASMNYSVYNDVWGSDPQVVGYSEMDDFSGCASSVISRSTTLYSPTRSAVSSGSTAYMSFDVEGGDWTVVGTYNLACNCSPYGGSHMFPMSSGLSWHMSIKTTWYTDGQYNPPFCYYPTTACTSGIPTCNQGTGINLSGGCPIYYRAEWLVATRGASNLCLFSVGWGTSGNRTCS